MPILSCTEDPAWLPKALESLRDVGYAVVEDVLAADEVRDLSARMRDVQARILADVGADRLRVAGEHGVLRNMLGYDLELARLVALPEVLALVDATVGSTAILHLQNGFILPSLPPEEATGFQHSFHRDFPRHLGGYLASVNAMVTLDDYTVENGATLVVPGSHQRDEAPDPDYLAWAAVPVECAAGSVIAFDSTLWHAAGQNRSGSSRISVNQQYTRSYIKQQIDYVRALGDAAITSLPERVQQLLGWYTRVVTSLDEYYRPSEERLYRSGQG